MGLLCSALCLDLLASFGLVRGSGPWLTLVVATGHAQLLPRYWGAASLAGPACLSLAEHPAVSPPWLWEAGSGLWLLQTLSRVVCPKGCSLVIICTVDLGHGLKPVYSSAAFSQILYHNCSPCSLAMIFHSYFLQSVVLVYLIHRGK